MKNSIFSVLLCLCLLELCSACTSNDLGIENVAESKSPIENKINKSKIETIGHNIMLDNFYEEFKKHPISVNKIFWKMKFL